MDRRSDVWIERAPLRCPQCHDAVAEAEHSTARVCERCLARHHCECWGGRCGACAFPRHVGQATALAAADPFVVDLWGALADHAALTAARRAVNVLGVLLALVALLSARAGIVDGEAAPGTYLRTTLGGGLLSTLALSCVLNTIHARGRPPAGCWARCWGLLLAALPWTTYLYFLAWGWRGPGDKDVAA